MYIIVHEPQGPLVLNDKDKLAAFCKGKLIVEASGGMVYNENGQLLMMFRRGQWDLPKGKIDEGETIEACAIREVEEETGLKGIKLIEPLQITYHTYTYRGNDVLKPSHWFKMECSGRQQLIPQLEEDITELRWVDRQEAAELMKHAYPSIRELVVKYFLGENSTGFEGR